VQGRRPLGDEFVKLLVLSQEALRQHLDSTPDFKELLALSRLKILAEQEYQEIVRRTVVTAEETSKYYADHQSDFDAVQVLQVVVRKKPEGAKEGIPGFPPEEAKTRAEEIHKAFIAGDDPKKIADKYRMENFVRVDEQPYTVRRGSMRADMEKAAFELKPGQVTDVYDLGQALVFVKVVSHQTEDLKNVSARIENTLRQQKINAALETLRQNSKVWMDDAYFAAPAGGAAPPKPPTAAVGPAAPTPK
jgi:parvulin-like peptidyl-prolyl isomerase